MPDILSDRAGAKRRKTAVESFLGALVKGARTVSLYKDGHVMIGQVTARVNELLKAAIGEEPNLALEMKAKSVIFEEEPLAESEESIRFASTLHGLGIGQLVFTNRLEDSGLLEFMRLLTWKPTEAMGLSQMQKELGTKKIDGMQLISILSFVVTGEQEEDSRNPGALSEEQIAAITASATLPDFLHLLLKQAELIQNKTAEDIVSKIDQVLNRDIPIEQFEREMAWQTYDPRIRSRFDELRTNLAGRDRWDANSLIDELSFLNEKEIALLKDHSVSDGHSSFLQALEHVHSILDKPSGAQQAKFALAAYARLLSDMARIGELGALLKEFQLWKKLAAAPAWAQALGALKSEVQTKLPTAALAEAAASRAGESEPDSSQTKELHDFVLTVGLGFMPLLLERFRNTTEKEPRARLTKFLAQLYKKLGGKALLESLKDEDYFHVIGIMGILIEMGVKDLPKHLSFLLDHPHEKVRAAVIQCFRRAGGPDAAAALASFVSNGRHPEQAQIAVTALSLIPEPGIEEHLMMAYSRNEDYDVRLVIVTALGRHPGPKTKEFLKSVAHQTLKEWFVDLFAQLRGAKESIRVIARQSLKQIDSSEGNHG